MSRPTVKFHPEADEEYELAKSWYATRSRDAALAFVEEFERAIQEIAAHLDGGLSMSAGRADSC